MKNSTNAPIIIGMLANHAVKTATSVIPTRCLKTKHKIPDDTTAKKVVSIRLLDPSPVGSEYTDFIKDRNLVKKIIQHRAVFVCTIPVKSFAPVTVYAEYLKSGRISLRFKKSTQGTRSNSSSATISM